MKVLVLYNSGEAQSLLSTMIMLIRFAGDTVTLCDLLGLDEAGMGAAIDAAADDTTQHRVYCTTTVDAVYAAKGHPSTAVNIATADDKIVAAPESGYEATVELGETVATAEPCLRAWLECFPTISWPQVVRYLSGKYFTLYKATADSVAAAALTDTGAFTLNQHKDKYVYVVSATTGVGQVKKILSNTANVLTIEPWDATPTGTVVYAIVSLKEEAYAKEAIETYIKGYLHNLSDRSTIQAYYKLLDYGSFDPSYNKIMSGAILSAIADALFVQEVRQVGQIAYQIGDRYTHVTAVSS